MKKMAIIQISPEILRDLLQLPEHAEVVRIQVEPGFRGLLTMVIDGAGWDTPEGAPLQYASRACIQKTWSEDGTLSSVKVNWNLPSTGNPAGSN